MVNTKIVNLGPDGGVKFFKFKANFRIGVGYQILCGYCILISPFYQHFTCMIRKSTRSATLSCLAIAKWTFFINLILLHRAILFSFEAGNQP